MDRLAELVDWLRAHYGTDLEIHITADWNTGKVARLAELTSRGLDAGPSLDTMHHAAIDRVLSTGTRVGAVVLRHLHTDHDALVRTVALEDAA